MYPTGKKVKKLVPIEKQNSAEKLQSQLEKDHTPKATKNATDIF